MKKLKIGLIIVGTLLLIVSFLYKKQPASDGPLTTVEINNKVINVGKRSISEETYAYFVLKNTGEHELRITDITS